MLVAAILYVVTARRSAGGSLGEAIVSISYLRRDKIADTESLKIASFLDD
jgi:hypothetical protein